jgi:hypothetical protein
MSDRSASRGGIRGGSLVLPNGVFWAKLGPTSWHPLAAHLLDVGAVVGELLAPGRALRHRLARLSEDDHGDMLAAMARYLALVHDAGKVHHGFQDRALSAAPPARRSHCSD